MSDRTKLATEEANRLTLDFIELAAENLHVVGIEIAKPPMMIFSLLELEVEPPPRPTLPLDATAMSRLVFGA